MVANSPTSRVFTVELPRPNYPLCFHGQLEPLKYSGKPVENITSQQNKPSFQLRFSIRNELNNGRCSTGNFRPATSGVFFPPPVGGLVFVLMAQNSAQRIKIAPIFNQAKTLKMKSGSSEKNYFWNPFFPESTIEYCMESWKSLPPFKKMVVPFGR